MSQPKVGIVAADEPLARSKACFFSDRSCPSCVFFRLMTPKIAGPKLLIFAILSFQRQTLARVSAPHTIFLKYSLKQINHTPINAKNLNFIFFTNLKKF